ncbi:MAG: hypothetical protein GKR91_08490 [Pseudomonadales bacterium]|nr:hypothetical protein [Pseudomonadales bacterium]
MSTSALLAALLVGGYLIFDEPFQSSRTPSGLSTSLLDTRMWEDPLKPILSIRAREEQIRLQGSSNSLLPLYQSSVHDADSFLATVARDRPTIPTLEKAIILGVLLPAQRYTLTSELRRRIRYAVVSAINQTHVPVSSEQISLLQTDLPIALPSDSDETTNLTTEKFEKILMSFELYQPYLPWVEEDNDTNEFRNKDVVILWIPEDSMGTRIIDNYESILEKLYVNDPFIPTSALMGPTNSNALVDLYKEIADATNAEVDEEYFDLFRQTTQTDIQTQSVQGSLGEFNAYLRTQLDDLISEADFYLDSGMSESKRLELLACYRSNDYGQVTAENAANCLTSLEIADSDFEWANTVAYDLPSALPQRLVDELSRRDSTFIEDLNRLIEDTDWYLDFGLSDDKRIELVDAVVTNAVASFYSENVALYLERLNIEDGDPTWFDEIASYWPTQIATNLLQSLPAAHQYGIKQILKDQEWLDVEFTAQDQLVLINCFIGDELTPFTQPNVENCLSSIFTTKSGSVDVSYVTDFLTYPDSSELRIEDAAVSNPELAQLIQESDTYLDFGLSAEKREELETCVARFTDSIYTFEGVSNCLASLNIADSDSTWFNFVAESWPVESMVAASQQAEERFQEQVLEIMIDADEYLDIGLSEQKQDEFISCLPTDSRFANLTRNIVTNCLEQLEIADSDPEWESWVSLPLPIEELFSPVVVISPRATISKRALDTEVGSTVRESSQVIRSITRDDIVLQNLIDELYQRNLDPIDSRIALIYESDGKYGRALESNIKCFSTNPGNRCFSNVDSFGYLRGIDGQLPSDNQESNTNRNSSSDSIAGVFATLENLEDPFGRHQYDYLRRISDQVGSGRYDAIGVLGTDIFDKLLVLQALREKNPNAVFFTTDLDDFMGHSSQRSWTQNLLVGSALGLAQGENSENSCRSLLKPGQSEAGISVPPFRDSYQTSYFYSTCAALTLEERGSEPVAQLLEGNLSGEVQIFEISRNGAVAISSTFDDKT